MTRGGNGLQAPQEMYQVLVSKTTLTDVNSKFSLLKFPLFTNPQGQAVNLIIVIRDAYFSYQIEKMVADDKVEAEIMTVTTICYPPPLTATPPPGARTRPTVRRQRALEAWVQEKPMIVHYTTLPTEDWTIAFYTPKNHYYMVTRHLNQIALLMVIALVSGL